MPESFAPRHKKVILYCTHFWDEACEIQFNKLQNTFDGEYDVIVLGYLADNNAVDLCSGPNRIFYRASDFTAHAEFCYPNVKYWHLNGVHFFDEYPDYEHYWMIEYDVRYNADWAILFNELNDPDVALYATVIQGKPENKDWAPWTSLCTGKDILTDDEMVKVFAPLMRLSNAAFRAISAAYQCGWYGHYEAMWPTAVARAGLKMEDIGAAGTFTPPARRGRHYSCAALDPYLSPGSFVFRPSILEDDVPAGPPMLWHPVKSASMSAALPEAPGIREPGWRDFSALQPLRKLWRLLRKADRARQAAKN